MRKYIDADKLIAEIDKKWKELADKNVKVGGGKYDIEISTYLSIKNLIDSLRQEQPEVDLEKEIKDKYSRDTSTLKTREQYTKLARHFYDLGCRHTAEEADRIEFERQEREDRENRRNFPEPSSNFPKIKGWVARDEDGSLNFFSQEFGDGIPIYDRDCGMWGNATEEKIGLPHQTSPFGDLTFQDDPIEVELTINRVEK